MTRTPWRWLAGLALVAAAGWAVWTWSDTAETEHAAALAEQAETLRAEAVAAGASRRDRPTLKDDAKPPPPSSPPAPRDRDDTTGAGPSGADALRRLAEALQQVERQRQQRLAETPADTTDPERVRFSPDAAGIRAAVKAAIPDLKACYEPWLGLNPDLEGKLTLSFRLPTEVADGGPTVTDVETTAGTVGNELVDGCVRNVFAGLDFTPPADEDVTVNYPLVFNAAPDDQAP